MAEFPSNSTPEQLFELLQSLNYNGRVTSAQELEAAVSSGQISILFFDLAGWLSSQLRIILECEEEHTDIKKSSDGDVQRLHSLENKQSNSALLVELWTLLKDLSCPIQQLSAGFSETWLVDKGNKIKIIEYLIQELLSARIVASKAPQNRPLEIEVTESKPAKELKEMLVSLSFSKPPNDITPRRLFTEVEKRVTTLSKPLLPKDQFGDLIFTGALTSKQWCLLQSLYEDLRSEYSNRRNMHLQRLELTIQSFLWSDQVRRKAEEITQRFAKSRTLISTDPAVNLSDVLSATVDLSIVEKTSSDSVRTHTQSAVNKVRIGNVPDRGGRPSEQQPPPPEVPSWQKNDSSSRGGNNRGQANFSSRQNQERSKQAFQYTDQVTTQPNYHQNNQGGGGNYHQNNQGGGGNYHQNNQGGGGNYSAGRNQQQWKQPAGDNFGNFGNPAASNPAFNEPRQYGQRRPGGRGGFRGRGGHRGYNSAPGGYGGPGQFGY